MNQFNYKLKNERMKKNITMKDLAIQLNITPDTYRKYERGDREPDFDTLIKIADYLQTSTDYLLGRYDNRAL